MQEITKSLYNTFCQYINDDIKYDWPNGEGNNGRESNKNIFFLCNWHTYSE
jgi:hypothetical protein